MSEFFRWEPGQHSKWSLQIEEVDREHGVLIELMSALAERAEEGASKAELSGLLKELVDYTVLHFQAEEACASTWAASRAATEPSVIG
jgi:hemerythrin-like metal-binding protein